VYLLQIRRRTLILLRGTRGCNHYPSQLSLTDSPHRRDIMFLQMIQNEFHFTTFKCILPYHPLYFKFLNVQHHAINIYSTSQTILFRFHMYTPNPHV